MEISRQLQSIERSRVQGASSVPAFFPAPIPAPAPALQSPGGGTALLKPFGLWALPFLAQAHCLAPPASDTGAGTGTSTVAGTVQAQSLHRVSGLFPSAAAQPLAAPQAHAQGTDALRLWQQQQQQPHPHLEHQPPPDSDLAFAEEACVPEEREDARPAPRLTPLSVCKSLVAGGVAGAVSRTAVAPLERLKILQQVQSARGVTAPYRGMWRGLHHIWLHEGLNGLFRGNGVNCARIVPNSAVKFFAYEEASQALLWAVREQTGNAEAELTPLLRLGAGAIAGIIAMSATYPMDMVRGRLTVQSEKGSGRKYRNMIHAMATVWREEGPTALYRGWLPSVIGVVPYVGLNFAVYETLKDWTVKHYAQEQQRASAVAAADAAPAPPPELSVLTKLGCGAVAGTIGQTVAYPLDVVRRRLQMVGWKDAAAAPVLAGQGAQGAASASAAAAAAGAGVAPQYTGMVDAFRKTVQMEGVGALYRGLLPNSVKVVPSIAIAFVTYEAMKDMLGVEIRISD